MTLVKIVPMAFVMIAGPQIISLVMFATSARARANSLAYVSGAMTSTVGGYLSAHNESLVKALTFVLLTGLLVGSPLLVLLTMGKRAEATLPKIRDWMSTNSWIVSEIVIVFFLVMELRDALAA